MRPRQTRPFPWPRRWLVTDERMGDALWRGIRTLPRGSGVLFRHHGLDRRERIRLGREIARWCRRRGLLLAVSRDVGLARQLGAALVHNPAASPGLLPVSRSVHRQADLAESGRAALLFLSPVFETRSHPGARPLGLHEAGRLARLARAPSIALGGVDERRFTALRASGFAGYAGIDCWIRI